MTTQKHEALIFANDRPSEIGDDLYQWAVDAEDMIRHLHAHVQELEAEKARLIETYVPCPSATEAYLYGIAQEKS